MKAMTLGLVVQKDKLLLGMKKRGFGAGLWNGFGGKLHDGEKIEEALVREFQEEAGITPTHFEKQGIISFFNENETDNKEVEVHIYRIDKYKGKPSETEEMRPKWFSLNQLPFESMWPDDSFWMPLFLKGKKFTGNFVFDKENNIIDQKLNEVNKL